MTHRRFRRDTRLAGVALGVVLAGSVALFASLNAWRTAPAPLANTLASPEAVGNAVLSALRAGDSSALRTLALTEEEFRNHVWPDLPVSRPERNVPFEYVWGTLHQNSEGYLHETLAAFRDEPVTLKRVDFGGPSTSYDDVTVHRESRLLVETADGRERVVRLFGSMIEQDGGWKVFSYVVD